MHILDILCIKNNGTLNQCFKKNLKRLGTKSRLSCYSTEKLYETTHDFVSLQKLLKVINIANTE